MGCKKLDISKNYESVLTVVGKYPTIETQRVGNFLATKKLYVNYFPFHSIMPGRSFNSSEYRYGGAGGQEKDDEITGVTGSHYTAEYWEYDSRIGRRWNTDPVVYAWQSSYAAFNNNPIYFNDPSGAVAQGGGDDDKPAFTVNGPEFTLTEDKPKQGFFGKLWDGIKKGVNNFLNWKQPGGMNTWGSGREGIGEGTATSPSMDGLPAMPISTGSLSSGGLLRSLEIFGGVLGIMDNAGAEDVIKDFVVPFKNPNNPTKTTATDVQAKTQEVNNQAHGNVEGKIEGIKDGAERQFEIQTQLPESVYVKRDSTTVGAGGTRVYHGVKTTKKEKNTYGTTRDTLDFSIGN